MAFNGTGSNVTALNASNISSGTVATGRLATSGTASNTTFLRGDQIWSALPAGGGLTNNVRQAVTSSATTTLDVNSGNVVDLTMASNITTLAFSNVPASGTPLQLVLVFRNAADATNYQVTWPASIYWNTSAINTPSTSLVGPTLAYGANTITVISLLTTDGGTKWRGWVEASIQGTSGSGNSSIYSWGQNSQGQLGQGDTSLRSSPIQVGALEIWGNISISGYNGNAVGGILNTGQLYMWGNGYNGNLGFNNILNYNSPKQVGALTNWAKISAGSQISGAIKTDGTLWMWGQNINGGLGQGNVISRSSPVQVGALTNWAQISTLLTGALAIKTDGTLWSWGRNTQGQLGHNNTINASSPVQVGALTDWAKLNTVGGPYNVAAAIKTDGTLWTWGRGNNGGLGHGNATSYSSPKQVGALTNWASIGIDSAATLVSSGALKTDGTLWSWGLNAYGQLGLNNRTNYNSPKQIGVATDWSKISPTTYSTLATKTGGTLWSWGFNDRGQLGQNDRVNRSSPVQVGAETYWVDVSAGGQSVFGLRTTPAVNPA